ncbi:MAG: hypothetical protein HYR90_03245 [Candidatus Andersenbacteria bacterium]|nr:hypothetical protein [Candidatus Andersenbacteria bacterium]MBI3250280.1 hypothetical protein [Candidatus Andersenbacteria bacterium]
MEFLGAVLTVAIPLSVIIIPGFAAIQGNGHKILLSGARMMLWSLSVLTLLTFLFSWLGISLVTSCIVAFIGAVTVFWLRRDLVMNLPAAWVLMAIVLPVVLATAAFALPYFAWHDGQPTGDSQKAIIWAQEIIEEGKASYSRAVLDYNRDPGDFFTPGLHTLTALVMTLSPYPLMSVGVFAIVGCIVVAWLAATISRELFKGDSHIILPLVAAFFVLTNTRFLRYLREPGYHYQNIFGEIFLFGLLLLGLRLIKKFSWQDFSLAVTCLAALILTHQFSVFMAVFTLVPVAASFFLVRISRLRHHSRQAFYSVVSGGALIILLLVAAIPFGFYDKLPHLFTTAPHLLADVPNLTDYPAITGGVWFFLGLAGFILLAKQAFGSRNPQIIAFTISVVVFLLLSQGPRLFIDIPPVRALFYSVVPLSILAAYFIMQLRHYFSEFSKLPRRLGYIALIILVGWPAFQTTQRAFATTNHTIRTNSTLLPEHEYLAGIIAQDSSRAAVLVDDYNRRSSSWLILSGKPMYTRIAADLQRQMNEARQSETRMDLYLKQLDFEKIFSLGSMSEIGELLQKHNIKYITGVEKSSDSAFASNPILQEKARGADVILFSVESKRTLNEETAWLLKTSTLANDIGDGEDTFAHLPASVRSSRLSSPQRERTATFRSVSASVIPLVFNPRSYVAVLWDQEDTGHPTVNLELLVKAVYGPEKLEVVLPDDSRVELTMGQPLTIPAHSVIYNDKGLLELKMLNPEEKPIGIDLIALGLARIP